MFQNTVHLRIIIIKKIRFKNTKTQIQLDAIGLFYIF